MPENLEKFTSPDQSKESGKLTPEEVKEMVKKFKEEHEGLLPEYFSLPGEEKEEEREYSEETILAYELKEFLEKMRPEIENKNLIKNAEEYLKVNIQKSDNPTCAWWAVRVYISFKQLGLWSKLDQKSQDLIEKNIQDSQLIKKSGEMVKSLIESGQKPGETWNASWAVCDYTFFKQSGLWSKLDQEFRDWAEKNIKNPQLIKNAEVELKSRIESSLKSGEILDIWLAVFNYISFKQLGLWSKLDQESQDLIEKNIKNPQLIKNVKKDLESHIKFSQKPGKTLVAEGYTEQALSAAGVVYDYVILSQFQKILEEQGRKKEALMESQRAMHPEKKKLPPIPEEKAF
jgi:hypothetical protein